VGLSAVASKILCRKHNSELSAVDSQGIVAIRALDGSAPALGSESQTLVNGEIFERWLLKTAINVSYGSSLVLGVGMADSQPGIPPPYLLAVVFGGLAFSHRMGAYFLIPACDFKFRSGEITVIPIHKDGQIGGFYFHLRGVDLFLSLLPGSHPPTLRELGPTSLPQHILDAEPHYRSSSIITSTNDGPPLQIRFSWPQQSR